MAAQIRVEGEVQAGYGKDCGCGCGGVACGTERHDCGCGCGGTACGSVMQKMVLVGSLADQQASSQCQCDGSCGCRD